MIPHFLARWLSPVFWSLSRFGRTLRALLLEPAKMRLCFHHFSFHVMLIAARFDGDVEHKALYIWLRILLLLDGNMGLRF
jgi:hypothetical protein